MIRWIRRKWLMFTWKVYWLPYIRRFNNKRDQARAIYNQSRLADVIFFQKNGRKPKGRH